jgi:hypothetical protein
VNRAISICSDNGAALLAFKSYAVFSRGVLQCEDFLQELALSNRVGLVWVPEHCGICKSGIRMWLKKPNRGLTRYLLRLPRSKLRILVGLITRHCP